MLKLHHAISTMLYGPIIKNPPTSVTALQSTNVRPPLRSGASRATPSLFLANPMRFSVSSGAALWIPWMDTHSEESKEKKTRDSDNYALDSMPFGDRTSSCHGVAIQSRRDSRMAAWFWSGFGSRPLTNKFLSAVAMSLAIDLHSSSVYVACVCGSTASDRAIACLFVASDSSTFRSVSRSFYIKHFFYLLSISCQRGR